MGKFFIDDFNIAKDIIYGRGRMINNYLKLLNENDKLKEYDTGFEEYKKNYKGLSNIYFELWLKTNNFFAINTYTEYLNDANYIIKFRTKYRT